MKRNLLLFLLGAVLLITIVPTAMISVFYLPDQEVAAAVKDTPAATTSTHAAAEDELPVVGSYENLKKLLARELEERDYFLQESLMDARPAMGQAKATASAPRGGYGSDADYATTNIQVAGVDEADIIKTDGTFLYQVRDHEVVISKAYPAKEMSVVKRLKYGDESFSPLELYVNEEYLVVIGQSQPNHPYYYDSNDNKTIAYDTPTTVKAIVYDNRDKAKETKVREVEIEGEYLTSRMIGSSLYLTSNRYLNIYGLREKNGEIAPPAYRDSVQSDSYVSDGYKKIRYFPDGLSPNYLIVAGLNLDQPKQKMSVSTYLGSGDNVYASLSNLYVAMSDYTYRPLVKTSKKLVPAPSIEQNTTLYKFSLKDGAISYKGKGEVPGSILNQFSMDEQNGYLRIATTTGYVTRDDEQTAKNHLYVLDNTLKTVGKLENIAPGEKIYSVRFMGNRAYMVTFKKVDPLFVIDLKKPESPQILGKLKIPGYSDYLHPYDENHLIGFGKDTVEAKGNFAYYQGMKMALFDVTDVNHPIEQFKEIIGDRGTDSELLHNHKALLFSKEKNLLAFPVTLMEKHEADPEGSDGSTYGDFTFQGAYVYQLDLHNGFKLRTRITHLDQEDLVKAGDSWYDSEKNVQRILYIKDMLYTVSQEKIKAHGLSSLREAGSLTLGK